MRRLLVTGSRSWRDADLIRTALRAAVVSLGVPSHEVTLVHGGASGADLLAEAAAYRLSMRVEVHRPAYDKHGRQAPLVRNAHMISLGADLGLAFAQRWASGTGHCARAARRTGIEVVDYGVDTTERASAAARKVDYIPHRP